MQRCLTLLVVLLISFNAQASETQSELLNLTQSWVGYASIGIFFVAYVLVILEEQLHLKNSKPVLLAAGIIWVLIAIAYNAQGLPHAQWLLVTLTAGVGGSLLSIGSAAGVALMGQARGQYTFFKPFKIDACYCAGLCRQYLGALFIERLTKNKLF